MKHLPSVILRHIQRGRRRTVLGRLLRGTLYLKLALAVVLGLAVGLLYLRLSAGPLRFEGMAERVSAAVAGRIGPGWTVSLRDSALELAEGAFALRATGLDIRNPEGAVVVRAPLAIVSVDTLSLLTGSLQPRSIEFRDLQLRGVVKRDGTVTFAAAGEAQGEAPPGELLRTAPAAEGGIAASPVSRAVASLFDLILEPTGIVGVLDRARVTNARLTLADDQNRDRATFERVNASFERPEAEGRRFDMSLEGPRGRWSLGGTMRRTVDGGRDGDLRFDNAPILDLLVLSGLANVPATTDLKVSGSAQAALRGAAITRLDARVTTSAGFVRIDDKDATPIPVEAAAADASWNEARRVLAFSAIDFKGGDTRVKLQGELSVPPNTTEWQLSLTGRDVVLSPPTAADEPVRLESVEASLLGREGGLFLERLALSGPGLSGAAAAAFSTAGERRGISVNAKAVGTSVRTALRIWPETVVPEVRRFLLANLHGGVAEELDVMVALSEDDLKRATSGGPIPDEAVRVSFRLRSAVLQIAEGLPPLSQAEVRGTVTGLTARLEIPQARAVLADGRSLTLKEGSFAVANVWPDDAAAQIAFRMEAGADALASFLQTPLMRTMAPVELDPATMKGNADLKVEFPIPLKRAPVLSELPIAVTGGLSDLSIDKAFGRDALDQGQLGLTYDRNGLSIRGDAKLGGAPASVEVRQPAGGPGEAFVSLVLDEPARARKGMSFGSQLTGTLPVRAVVPLGQGRAGTRIEADLTRSAIDNLIPGWTKPAGRPGKLSFSLTDGSAELRDIVLESGAVQVRGNATLTSDGTIDRAELGTFKLSQGDDMRVRVERQGAGHKVTVRGAVGDARPFIRSLTGPAAASGAKGDQGREVELDIGLNILTGFNDEALTNTALKASLKGRDLRQLQFNGRLKSANVNAQLVRRDRVPLLGIQSGDAGATLRFLDIYRRMVGGELYFQITMGDGPQAGSVLLQSFALRNEPALKRIISQPQTVMAEDRAVAAQMPQIDTNDVSFVKMRSDFTRNGNRLQFAEAVIWGAQIGFTLSGWIDPVREQTDISGTFVPAYGLNNVFAQVPLVGPLLGGGQNEGLFAINFRVAGSLGSPALTVNPLSAVAPGFLRKLFGTGPASAGIDGPAIPPRPAGER